MSRDKPTDPMYGTYVAYFLDFQGERHQLADLFHNSHELPEGCEIDEDGVITVSGITELDGYRYSNGEFYPVIVECSHRLHSIHHPLEIRYRCMNRESELFQKKVKACDCEQCPVRGGKDG